ncbi:MAG: peptidylprolyl isomerase [Dehalococcoidia bacterium]|nr:peptidylprolyl isomerase [Dehalococcoidia bacterium]
MPRPTKQAQRRTPGKTTETSPQDKNQRSKRNTIITALAIGLVIAAVAGIGYYLIYVMPFQRVILKVDDDVIKIDYFLRRVLTNPGGEDIFGTLQSVTNEVIIAQEAPRYGITVTPQDLDAYLRDIAKGESESITDAEYREWYRQRLNASLLSEKRFRELVAVSLQQQQLAKLMAAQVPNTAEQGHLWVILVNSYDEAVKVKQRADNGEVFANLAKELSIDGSTKENGGEVGWLPFDILDSRFASTVAALEIGKASEPLMNDQGSDQKPQNFIIFLVSEKSLDREVLPEHLEVLKAKAFSDWLNEQMSVKKITFHGLGGGGFDSETNAWLTYQVQRLRRGISGKTAEETAAPKGQQP